MRLALYQPDIPQNTGTLLRLGACLDLPIDIIEPCGFLFNEKAMRRAGMDYLEFSNYRRHNSWDDFLQYAKDHPEEYGRIVSLTTKSSKPYTEFEFLPNDNIPEYAFIGRSNVGKSSLINMLVQRRGLAKTSSVPGKTVAINHFIVNDAWYLVDLPGYGYAQHSKKTREQWRIMINNYIQRRRNLVTTFVLVDARLEPQNNDLGFMEWLGENQVPFCIVFTKADKVSKAELDRNVQAMKNRLLENWEELPPIFITSAEKKQGRDEVLDYIEQQNKEIADLLNKK